MNRAPSGACVVDEDVVVAGRQVDRDHVEVAVGIEVGQAQAIRGVLEGIDVRLGGDR
jgi:hypothetical protein